MLAIQQCWRVVVSSLRDSRSPQLVVGKSFNQVHLKASFFFLFLFFFLQCKALQVEKSPNFVYLVSEQVYLISERGNLSTISCPFCTWLLNVLYVHPYMHIQYIISSNLHIPNCFASLCSHAKSCWKSYIKSNPWACHDGVHVIAPGKLSMIM